MKITVSELKAKIIEEIAVSTETDLEITEETALYEDMGLASMEAYVLLCDLEETFRVRIQASSLRHVRTVGDLCELVVDAVRQQGRKGR